LVTYNSAATSNYIAISSASNGVVSATSRATGGYNGDATVASSDCGDGDLQIQSVQFGASYFAATSNGVVSSPDGEVTIPGGQNVLEVQGPVKKIRTYLGKYVPTS
jgi:hypothetical protein